MITLFRKIGVSFMFVASIYACNQTQTDNAAESVKPIGNAVYYWRTTFVLDNAERVFLKQHNVERIYLRMFDVALEHNISADQSEVAPIATTIFKSDIPDGIEIVPTVYITLDALRAMRGKEKKYAKLIVERMRAMASYNKCGRIREMQFDCDWTSETRTVYVALCQAASQLLHCETIELSATIRLHQLSETALPIDRGVLMLYNTGALKDKNTRNSILDIADVRPYMNKRKCNLPFDYAYPAFGWGVKFHDGKFQGIVSHPENGTLNEDDIIRTERPTADEILAVKTLVDEKLGQPSRYHIIYHLDNKQLKNYTTDEISKIYFNH